MLKSRPLYLICFDCFRTHFFGLDPDFWPIRIRNQKKRLIRIREKNPDPKHWFWVWLQFPTWQYRYPVPVDRIQQIISGIYESGSTALILFSPLVTEHSLYKNSIFTDSDLQHSWELVFNVLTEYKNVT